MRLIFKKKKFLSVLTVAVSAVAAVPILLFPVGYGRGASDDFLVNQAYAATFPVNPDQRDVLIEEYAIQVADDNTDGEVAVLGEGQTVQASYFDTPVPVESYDGIFTAAVVRYHDEGDVPVEILDEETFSSAGDVVNYIQTTETIIKEEPIMSSYTLATIHKTAAVTRISDGDSWSKILTEDGIEGFVPTYCLSDQMVFVDIDRTVWVDSDGLALRAEASAQSDLLDMLSVDTRLHCTEVADKWFKVTTPSGQVGFVAAAYTTQTPPPTPTPIPTPTPPPAASASQSSGSGGGSSSGGGGGGSSSGSGSSGSSSGGGGGSYATPTVTGVNGESIRSICESMLGVPYVWAGESRNGVDCSGLVVYAYRQLGIQLPHLADSLKSVGVGVERSSLAVGDIICWSFNGSNYASHTGIYVGGGQVIHASASRGDVRYGSVDMGTIVGMRRVIQ